MQQAPGTAAPPATERRRVDGGRFDFDDGGAYCGGWDDGKAHGHGVCTGPKGQGAYSGSWHYGFEVSGVYAWPSGSSFEGQWQNGKRHGLGVETRGRWLYRGEWTQGFKGRYGVRQSATSNAKYEGTWANGLQDGYGSETYADGGTYQGQWLRGMRHGYGVRASAPFGLASHYRPGRGLRASLTSLRSAEAGGGGGGGAGAGGREAPTPDPAERRNHRVDDSRGGFVLKARSDEPPPRRNSLVEKTKKGILSGLKIRKQRSTGDLEKRGTGSGSIRSAGSSTSWVSSEGSAHSGVTNASLHTDSNASFIVEDEHLDASVTETYMGEWKNDKRTGFGVSERSDGLRYEGEWFANRKYGYGVTTFRDGTKEEGKYKNNVLITSQKRKHLFLIRSAKFRERIDAAVNAAQRASKIALQKADIAISRTATARGKAEQADLAADQAKEDCELAQITAKQFAPDFKLPNLDRVRLREKYRSPTDNFILPKPIVQPSKGVDQLGNQMQNQTPNQMPNQIPNQIPAQQAPQNKSQLSSSIRRPSEAYPQAVQPNDSKYAQPASAFATSNLLQNQNQNISPQTNLQQSNNYQQNYDYQQQQNQTAYQPQNQNFSAQQQILQQQAMSAINNNYQQSPTSQQPSYQQLDNMAYQQQNSYANLGQQSQQTNIGFSIQNQNLNYNQPLQNQNIQQQQYQQQNANQYQNHAKVPPDIAQDPYSNKLDNSRIPGNVQANVNLAGPGQPGWSVPSNVQTYNQTQRRSSKAVGDRPPLVNQSSIDHFDHYKRPPSRDSSVDRYARATGRLSLTGGGSRQPSVDKTTVETPDRTVRGQSQLRSGTPVSQTGNGMVLTGRGSGATTPVYNVQTQQIDPNQPFEEILLRKRTLGQDIIPSMNQPKRTESLYAGSKVAPTVGVSGGGGGGGGGLRKMAAAPQPLQRKKSLPDVQGLPKATDPMSREEVSLLGSARREELRRMADESERLRANPLLYLVSPQVKDWFSRQQLVLLVLFVNISLAIMFFKLLT